MSEKQKSVIKTLNRLVSSHHIDDDEYFCLLEFVVDNG